MTLASGGTDIAVVAGRLAERLRQLPLARLRAPLAAYDSRARAGLAAAQALAELAQGVELRAHAVPPSWREVPWLGELPVGDQVAVTGADVHRALRDVPAEADVWTRSGRRPAGRVLEETAARVREIKQLVD